MQLHQWICRRLHVSLFNSIFIYQLSSASDKILSKYFRHIQSNLVSRNSPSVANTSYIQFYYNSYKRITTKLISPRTWNHHNNEPVNYKLNVVTFFCLFPPSSRNWCHSTFQTIWLFHFLGSTCKLFLSWCTATS